MEKAKYVIEEYVFCYWLDLGGTQGQFVKHQVPSNSNSVVYSGKQLARSVTYTDTTAFEISQPTPHWKIFPQRQLMAFGVRSESSADDV